MTGIASTSSLTDLASLQVPPASVGGPMVSVVMTTYNVARYVDDAIRSVLAQTFKDLELIVVDDFSSDRTVERIQRWAKKDTRVRLLRCSVNRGTYWAKNLGIMHARGRFVTMHDSDDVSTPERIEKQVSALRSQVRYKFCCTLVERVTPEGEVVLNRGLPARRAYQTMMFDREYVVPRAGFYDTVRFAADDEHFNRLLLLLGRDAYVEVAEVCYQALVREDSLTRENRASLDQTPGQDPLAHLSPDRRAYVLSYREWHDSDAALTMPFPARSRPFTVSPAMRPQVRSADPVIASMASVPSREPSLRSVVERLLPQVDQLNVFLNHYETVPPYLDQPRISVARSQDHEDLRDNGKFFFLDPVEPAYHITVDDDMDCPNNYVPFLIAKIEQFGRRALVGVHGSLMKEPVRNYFATSDRAVFHFRNALLHDTQVHALGTGTLAYHTSTLSLGLEDFPFPGMTDIWVATKAQRYGVPMVAVPRPAGWLSETDMFEESLYTEYKHRGARQTRLVQQSSPWELFPL
jgi:glycosyltransferase involved in cell wall biosynthesis